MPDISDENRFQAAFYVDVAALDISNGKAAEYTKERAGADIGVRISKEKGWTERKEKWHTEYSIDLYIFTPEELADYRDEILRQSNLGYYVSPKKEQA